MKVLMFGWEFPPHITGGLGTACYGLVKGLLKKDLRITFVVPKAYGDEDKDVRILNASDIPVNLRDKKFTDFHYNLSYLEIDSKLYAYQTEEEYYRLKNSEFSSTESSEKTILSSKYKFAGGYGKNIYEEVERYAMIAAEIASTESFDLIHAHDWLTYKAGIAAKNLSGIPLVVHVHATEFDRSGENVNQRVYDIERMGMHAADAVIAVSNLTRNIVIEKYGVEPEKVFVVHNGVEPIEKPDFDEEKNIENKVVTFLGRITYQKGPDYFLEAANKVRQYDKDVHFVMAGSGDMLPKMIRRVARVKMGNKFHFAGFLKGEEVDRMFVHSDVYVMPSVSEPFGISPLEAMRSNVPVIISKQSGVSEILKYALKVDFWDIDQMSDYIYALLHYEGISKMFSKYGKEEVDNLIWDHAAEKVYEVYLNYINK